METEDWPIALSVVHLDGGLYAVHQAHARTITIFAGGEQNASHKFQIRSYQDLYEDLYKLGVLPLGVVFYYHQRQVDGIDPPESRHFFNLEGRGAWPSEYAAQTWSQIGHTAFSQKDIPLMDLCHRITFELRACVMKWFDLSNAYSRTLSGIVKEGNFQDGRRVDNANYILKHSGTYISKMASLAKKLRNEENIEHPLVPVVRSLTDNDSGWLAKMSAYRDLLIHYAPAGMVKGRAFTMHRAITLSDGVTLPSLAFYLPAGPHDIKRARARGGQFVTFEEWATASRQTSSEKDLEALSYCHLLVGQMAVLAIAVADYSPVHPTMMTFSRPT
jgi:hypothetical protein